MHAVAHKLRQFEAWLADALENFRIHQEGLISRIPKPVRSMTMREFQKYGGDVQAASKGLQRDKLGGGPEAAEVDKLARKRKWVASQEADAEASGSGTPRLDSESSRAVKNGETGIPVNVSLAILMNPSSFPQRAWWMTPQKQNLARQLGPAQLSVLACSYKDQIKRLER